MHELHRIIEKYAAKRQINPILLGGGKFTPTPKETQKAPRRGALYAKNV